MIYALDSNIISYMLKKDKGVIQHFDNTVKDTDSYAIPPIVYYEVKRWLVHRNATAMLERFSSLYDDSVKGNMSAEVWEKSIDLYARLRSSGKTIDDADIFIAAYCILNGYVLATNNTQHFSLIPELKIVNWKSE